MSSNPGTPAPDPQESFTTPEHPLLLFFDGDCSFCTRWVARLMSADTPRRIRFAKLDGPTFQRLARVYPKAREVESVILVQRQEDGRERYFIRSTAIRKVIFGLPSFRVFWWVLHVVPTPLSDLGYMIVSKLREPLFTWWADQRPDVEKNHEVFLD